MDIVRTEQAGANSKEADTGAAESDALNGTVEKKDALVDGANETTESTIPDSVLSDAMKRASASATDPVARPDMAISISPGDKEEFIRCVVSGDRYRRGFSIYGGAVTGVLRCPTSDELIALTKYVTGHSSPANVGAMVDFSSFIRNAYLRFLVEELNGVAFGEVDADDLLPRYDFDSNSVVDPKWVEEAKSWNSRPPAVISAIFSEIMRFLGRYWRMVEMSDDANFWEPAESTEE